MKRRAPLQRRSPMRRRRNASTAYRTARRRRLELAAGRCEARAPGCTHGAVHTHHIRRRSQGGADELDNLLAVCASCHDWIHRNPEHARRNGWLI